MDGSVIREVVIKTRIEHERAPNGPRPMNGPAPPPGAGNFQRLTGPPGPTRQDNNVFQQLRLMSDVMREDVRLSRERNRILRDVRSDMRRIRTPVQSGGSGSGGRGSSQFGGSNPFSTGIGALDNLNNVGFQMFITAGTVRMTAGLVTGGIGAANDFFSNKPGTLAGGLGSLRNSARTLEPGGQLHEFAKANQSNWFQSIWRPLLPKAVEETFFDDRNEIGLQRAMSKDPTRNQSGLELFEQARQGIVDLMKLEEMRSSKAIAAAQQEFDLVKKRFDTAKEEFGLSNAREQQASFDIARKIRDQGIGSLNETELEFIRGRQGFRGAIEKFSQQNANEQGFAEFASILGLLQERVVASQKLQEVQIKVDIDGQEVLLENAFDVLVEKFASVLENQFQSADKKLQGALDRRFNRADSAKRLDF